MTSILRSRTTEEVFEHHLDTRALGHEFLEIDLVWNYSDDVVILTNYGVFRGKDGVRQCAAILREQVPSTDYRYTLKLTHGEVAYLEWSAPNVRDGSDTFLIRDGRIQVQTIRYTPEVSP